MHNRPGFTSIRDWLGSRGARLAPALLLALVPGCSADEPPELTCGPGTRLVDEQCVPTGSAECGPGTVRVGGQCVADTLLPGDYLSPFVPLQALRGAGSHTEEVRIREDGLLLNCSDTFNVIDATRADAMQVLSEGNRHVIPGVDREPGCKHLAWDGDLVFTTHMGDPHNPSFLSGWDISDPESPVQLHVLQEPGISYEGVAVANGNIFVGLHGDGLGVYQYDREAGFTRVDTMPGFLDGLLNVWGIAARGDLVVVADGRGHVGTVDATDPTLPVPLERVVVSGGAWDVVLEGDIAYVAAGVSGVAVVDISDPSAPEVVGWAEMPGTALRVAYSEGHLFVAAWNEVRAYDVSDPTAPRFVGAVRVPQPFTYEDADREPPATRISGVAARGRDVFIGAWENPHSYRFEPEREAPNIRLPETSTRLDFGPVAANDERTILFKVTNQGTAPLTLVKNWVSGDAFSVRPRQAQIPPGESVELEISYRATSTEQEVGYLHVVSDDPAAPVRRVYLVGNAPGVSVGAPLPETTATLLDGTSWSSKEAEGKMLLLSFFTADCPACANYLQDVAARFWGWSGEDGLEVVALDPRNSTDDIDKVQAYYDNLFRFDEGMPVGIEEPATTYDAVASSFDGPYSFPIHLVVDQAGIVRHVSQGFDLEDIYEALGALSLE